MGAETNKPGPMVQAALDVGGVEVVETPIKDIIHTPSLPISHATVINDGSTGHALVGVIKLPLPPPKKPQ